MTSAWRPKSSLCNLLLSSLSFNRNSLETNLSQEEFHPWKCTRNLLPSPTSSSSSTRRILAS